MAASLRIALASDWFAPRRGGIEAQLLQLSSRLAQRGHHVDVLTSTPRSSDGDGFRVLRVGSPTLPGLDLAFSPTLIRDLQRELGRGYDVVHAHVSVVSPVGYTAAVVARSLGLPTVVTFHSILRHKRHLLRAMNAVTNLAASSVMWTAVSELVASQVRWALRKTEVGVLPNGIDLAFWGAVRQDAPHREGIVTLVSAMRLHRKKRPRPLLAAFGRAVSGAATPVVLHIVGDGPERPAMERDIRAFGLDRGAVRVEMPGWLSAEALRSAYAAADGFVLASTRESFGIAALEAAAAGLPVIAMAESGSREFLADFGNSSLCDDDEDLARTIARFLAEPAPRSLTPVETTPLRRYDWSAVLSEHEATYRHAITRAEENLAAVVSSAPRIPS